MLTIKLGNKAEAIAKNYLISNGLTLIEQQYNCRYGELDLIMKDKAYLVFIEVRYRKNDLYGGAIESIDHRKQSKLRKTAEHYLLQNQLSDRACRFDVVCLNGDLTNPVIEWLCDAF